MLEDSEALFLGMLLPNALNVEEQDVVVARL